MIIYEKARAIQELRFIRPSEEARRDRAKPKRNHRRLEDLLGAVAGWMADLGIRGRHGGNRPARSAY